MSSCCRRSATQRQATASLSLDVLPKPVKLLGQLAGSWTTMRCCLKNRHRVLVARVSPAWESTLVASWFKLLARSAGRLFGCRSDGAPLFRTKNFCNKLLLWSAIVRVDSRKPFSCLSRRLTQHQSEFQLPRCNRRSSSRRVGRARFC